MFLLGKPAEEGMTTLDVGRIHYENVRFYGGGDDMESVAKANERHDLEPKGTSLFIGAGGPMGQMHVQRAIELDNGSKSVWSSPTSIASASIIFKAALANSPKGKGWNSSPSHRVSLIRKRR